MGARRRSSPPFRAWGLALSVAAAALASRGLWWQTVLVLGILALYLLVFRLTRCRVETGRHRPCRWRVRGFLGTCDYHVGDKRRLPVLVRGTGFVGLPTFMWPRDDYARAAPETQPSGGGYGRGAIAQRAKRPAYDWTMMWLAGLGVVVALASFLRDLIAG